MSALTCPVEIETVVLRTSPILTINPDRIPDAAGKITTPSEDDLPLVILNFALCISSVLEEETSKEPEKAKEIISSPQAAHGATASRAPSVSGRVPEARVATPAKPFHPQTRAVLPKPRSGKPFTRCENQLNRTSGHGAEAGNLKLKTACCCGEGGEWDEKENIPPLHRVSFSVDL